LLEALSVSADNVGALRDKTVAEWIAMNKIADARLALNAPNLGSSEGEIDNCATGSWHWRQEIDAVPAIPGLVSITVSVRRTGAATAKAGTTSRSAGAGLGGRIELGPTRALGSVSAVGAAGCIATVAPGSSLGAPASLGAAPSLGAPPSLSTPQLGAQ